MILNPRDTVWKTNDHALIVDLPEVCRSYAARLEQIGCPCHSAESNDDALMTLELEPQIRVILVDLDHDLGDMETFVTSLRARRPGAIIIGTGTANERRDYFRRVGVDRFLCKPWFVDELLEVLT